MQDPPGENAAGVALARQARQLFKNVQPGRKDSPGRASGEPVRFANENFSSGGQQLTCISTLIASLLVFDVTESVQS